MEHKPLPQRTALISLGGNLGPVPQTIKQAVNLLLPRSSGQVQLSPLYRSRPMGADAGGEFLNAALCLPTTLTPWELLDQMQQIEIQLGRTRRQHWGPRTIDLDLIGMDDLVIDEPRLTLPHPGAWFRRFVLDPLVDVAPEWRHPLFRFSARELKERLLPRPLPICLSGLSRAWEHRLRDAFPDQIEVHTDQAITIKPHDHNRLLQLNDAAPSGAVSIGSSTLSPLRLEFEVAEFTSGRALELCLASLAAALDGPVRYESPKFAPQQSMHGS